MQFPVMLYKLYISGIKRKKLNKFVSFIIVKFVTFHLIFFKNDTHIYNELYLFKIIIFSFSFLKRQVIFILFLHYPNIPNREPLEPFPELPRFIPPKRSVIPFLSPLLSCDLPANASIFKPVAFIPPKSAFSTLFSCASTTFKNWHEDDCRRWPRPLHSAISQKRKFLPSASFGPTWRKLFSALEKRGADLPSTWISPNLGLR